MFDYIPNIDPTPVEMDGHFDISGNWIPHNYEEPPKMVKAYSIDRLLWLEEVMVSEAMAGIACYENGEFKSQHPIEEFTKFFLACVTKELYSRLLN
jgi:hypothetical protein